MKTNIISVTVEDNPGVLARVAMMFRRRAFNIASLTVGGTEVPGRSRMTIVINGDQQMVDQVIKQLDKLVEVLNIVDISKADSIERELVIIKVAADGSSRSEIIQIANVFRARIVDFAHNALIIEATGPDGKISAIIDLLKPYSILELTRTGKLAMVRSNDLSNKEEEI